MPEQVLSTSRRANQRIQQASPHLAVPAADFDLRDFGSTERLPGFLNTLAKKVLYTLFVNYPRAYSVLSLVPAVGASPEDIRTALADLVNEQLVERNAISDLGITPEERFVNPDLAAPDLIDNHIYVLDTTMYTRAIAVMHED